MNDIISRSPQAYSRVAKLYQFDVFYERERKMWNENASYKGVPIQPYIYINRKKYLGKAPYELTNLELMRAFTIAGVLKGYTVFDAKLMEQVIDKYAIKSIYDPCAGWGERMLCAASHDVEYHGVDINSKLKEGYDSMISDLELTNQDIIFGDSSIIDLDINANCVLTCPPYHKTEIYTDKGAENLSYDEFLKWWGNVVKNSLQVNPKYFCFQINQKYKEVMSQIVEENGFKFVEELKLNKKASHFNHSTKREYESMMIFERVLSD